MKKIYLGLLPLFFIMVLVSAKSPEIECIGDCSGGGSFTINEVEEEITIFHTGSHNKMSDHNDLDKYKSYTYFNRGKETFICNGERYKFDFHLLWARVLDSDGKQVSSAKVHLLSDKIFELGECRICYENENSEVTITRC